MSATHGDQKRNEPKESVMKILNTLSAMLLLATLFGLVSEVYADQTPRCKQITMSPYWAKVCLYDNNFASSGTEVEAVTIDYYVGASPAAADQDVGIWLGSKDGGKFFPIQKGIVYDHYYRAPGAIFLFNGVFHGGYLTAHVFITKNSTDATDRMLVDRAMSGELEFATVVNGRWDSRFGQNYPVGQL
jgi:hypothetical protein